MLTTSIFERATKAVWVLLFLFTVTAIAPSLVSAASPSSERNPVIMVLPFQINAPEEMDYLHSDLHNLLIQRLEAKGVKVKPASEVAALIRRENVKELDISNVRKLIRRAGVDAAVYGSYTQVGNHFSIDTRYVSSDPSESAKPFYSQQEDIINILASVEDIAARVTNELYKYSSISHIEVRGTKVLDPDVVLLRINTKQGDFVDQQALDRELKRIWDLGFFSDILVEIEESGDGLHLIYTVVEKPRIDAIRVYGADAIDEDEILSMLSVKPGAILNEKLLATDMLTIQEQYRQKGYHLAKVSQDTETDSATNSAILNLHVDEGNRLYIEEVVLNGAEKMSKGKLIDQLALTERGFLSWITGSGVLKEELLERDVSAMGAYYMNEGFMDIDIKAPKVDYNDKGITITHEIEEGPRYKVGDVTVSGDLIDTDETLLKLTSLYARAKAGEYFSMAQMQRDINTLTNYYAEYGYAFAGVHARPDKIADPNNPHINVNFTIEKRQKVYIRHVLLEGNTRTRDNVVLREMRLMDGDPFDGRKLGRSMERLNKLGYFEIAESELIPTNKPDEVDLKVKLQERSTGAISGGIGYSTYSSFGVSGSISENNIFGKGYNAGLQAQVTGKRTAYDLSFTNPRVNDSQLAFGVDLYNWKDDFWDYNKKTTGAGVRVGHPIGEYSSATLGYRINFYKLYDFDDDASKLIQRYEGNRIGSVASLRLTRDTTDKRKPTKGTISKINTEYGGGILGGDDDFIKVTVEFQVYQQLVKDHILHFRTRAAGLFDNGDKEAPPVYERFWMGGIDSVRGYRSRDIVPRDLETGDRLGGNRMWFANFEYIWSFSEELGMNLVPFFDIGANIDIDQEYNFSDSLKRSYGLELRWRSPMGDLRFSYGIPLDEDWRGDKLEGGRFEFSMGNFF